jgi:single-strand DNA-binding protein
MKMYNKFFGVGRITKDFDLKFTPNGHAVATTNIAIDSGFGDNKKTDFLPLVVWGKQAESVATYTHKGSLILVEGRVSTRNYEGKDGRKVYITEIIAENVRFLEKKEKEDKPMPGREVEFNEDDCPF